MLSLTNAFDGLVKFRYLRDRLKSSTNSIQVQPLEHTCMPGSEVETQFPTVFWQRPFTEISRQRCGFDSRNVYGRRRPTLSN